MRVERLATAAILTVALSGCGSGISVTNDWDPGVDFTSFKTFVVLDDAAGSNSGIDQLTRNRVKASIASNLQAKGFRQADNKDDADMAAGWQFTSDERSSFQTVSTGWGGYGYGWGGWYGAGGMGMTTSRTTETRYEVGSLVIALFDAKKKEMIFTATGSKTLRTDNPSPQEMQKRIDEAVAKILEKFPPPESGS